MSVKQSQAGIAIVGIACRFPGAPDHHQFWQNLCDGVESVRFFSDAELLAAGVSPALLRDSNYVKASPTLENIDQFDAEFFEFSPHEARLMDPQHRLLLEVAWEAFEDAGCRPGPSEPVGVTIGTGSVVTSYLLSELSDLPEAHGRTANLLHICNDRDFASTRISHKLNLVGPSINVQTACSTSMVAIHLACKSILTGECRTALAGASVVRVPHQTGYLSTKGGLNSPDGHVRTFDAEGRGTVFGSGVGAVLLKDLSAAIADGDHIYAVIKGSAIANDGGDKPSYPGTCVAGQARAMTEVFAAAGVAPASIGYVECHGTGTMVGDPIEVAALARAFGAGLLEGSCPIGSVKPNIGHPEQAAGMASLIKTALALKHLEIPPTINFHALNPQIDFAGSPFFVNTERRAWPPGEAPRRALVNSLGVGGTNAVVILEEAPPVSRPVSAVERPVHLLTLSAKSEKALAQLIVRHCDSAKKMPDDVSVADVCHTLAAGRSHFTYRYAAPVVTREDIVDRLSNFHGAIKASGKRKIGFLFSGQGAQFHGMGHTLYQTQPIFRAALDQCALAMQPYLPIPLLDILFGETGEAARINQTGFTQPALFAVEVALARLLEAWGIHPDVMVGHSVGEFAVAHLSGVYTLAEAAQLICARGQMMQSLPEGGAMAAVFAAEAVVREALASFGAGKIGVAAVNGPGNTVISGDAVVLQEVLTRLETAGIVARHLTVSHAFHSPLMEPMLADFRRVADSLPGQSPDKSWVSTLTGQPMLAAPTADYWCDHARDAVRFESAIKFLAAQGVTDFIEIGPGKSLLVLGQTAVQGEGLAWGATLGKGADAWGEIAQTVASLYCRGLAVDWSGFEAPYHRRRLPLPTYPFQRERFWMDAADKPSSARHSHRVPAAGLVGTRVRSPLAAVQFETVYSRTALSWLDDHRIFEMTVLPTTAGLVALLDGAGRHFKDSHLAIVNFAYSQAMVLADEESRGVQLVIEPIDSDQAAVRLVSTGDGDDAPWHTHMTGSVQRVSRPAAALLFDAASVRQRCSQTLAPDRYYAGLAALGFTYGPVFRGIQGLWRGAAESLSRVQLPDHVPDENPDGLHPALLDACLHVYPALIAQYGDFTGAEKHDGPVHLPLGIENFSVFQAAVRDVWVHARRRSDEQDGETVTVDIDVYDVDGRPVASFGGLTVTPMSAEVIRPIASAPVEEGWLYQVKWEERSLTTAATGKSAAWLLLADRQGTGDALAEELRRAGDRCRVVRLADLPGGGHLESAADLTGLLETLAAEAGAGRSGVISLVGLDAELDDADGSIEAAQRLVLGNTLIVAQAVADARSRFPQAPRLWLVTRNAVAATPEQPPLSIAQAGLLGFGRSFKLEHPQLWGGLADLAAGSTDVSVLAAHIRQADGEDQVAFRGKKRMVARFVRAPLPAKRATVVRGGTYLVTGGLGALGIETAKWLIGARGAHTIVLASRQGANAVNAAAVKAELSALGARIQIVKADTSQEADVKRLMQKLRKATPALQGIFHSAGVLDDGILGQMTWPKFRRALAPKMDAAWFLHRHSRDISLTDFVVFSSVLSLIGSAGQTNYTAGNAALDGLVAHRRAAGLPGLSLNWGPWASAGLASDLGEQGEAIWRARGVRYISTELGQQAFGALVDSDIDHAAVTLIDGPVFLRQFTNTPPFYAAFTGESGAEAAEAGLGADIDNLKARLQSPDGAERRAAIIVFIGQQVMPVLGLAKPVAPDRPLRELGLDSLMSITLINRLETALSVRIPAVKLIQGPSIEDLVDDLWPDLATEKPMAATQTDDDTAGGPVDDAPPENPGEPVSSPWLLTVGPRTAPRFRLFCFPFAGGGSATYRNWAAALDPAIEVIAIEPPGRLSRIHEPPVSDMDEFVGEVLAEMVPKLDLPFAMFGHCLGGLTSFAVAQALVKNTPFRPRHIFASGSRAPDRVAKIDRFEKALGRQLLQTPGYQPGLQPYEQPDSVFSEILRHFDMAATEQFLEQPELLRLMMPVVRAEFEMTNNFRYERERPWDIPITCFVSRGDPYVSREDILGWGRFTNSRLQVHMREGSHYSVYEDAAFITRIISRELTAPSS